MSSISILTLAQVADIVESIREQCALVHLYIDELTDMQRVQVRVAATAAGVSCLPRNLYYNYGAQHWIEGPDFPRSKP